jgi:putative spermidine/putrescine transport system permease protein
MISRNLNRALIFGLLALNIVWVVLPIAMAVLWSLVDPDHAWSYPDVLPPVISLRRWSLMWRTTSLPDAITNSYQLAPMVGLCALILGAPTAYAFGRFNFPGKRVAQTLALLPIVLPGFVIAIFFSSVLLQLNIFNKYLSILIGHTVLFLPYTIRILTVSFSQISQEVIDAARDAGAGMMSILVSIYFPLMLPGIISAFIIVFILSIEEFALAYVLGAPDFTTIPTILYSYIGGYQFIRPNAAVASLVLVVPNVIVLLFLERLLRSVGLSAGTKG